LYSICSMSKVMVMRW